MSAHGHTPEPARGNGSAARSRAPALTLRFSSYELDFARSELRREGALVALQPTPLRVLLYLAEHRDRTVSRRELLDAIWPGVVVGDEALTTALAEARHAVGDDGAAQRVVRTLKGQGYRFVVEVSVAGDDANAAAALAEKRAGERRKRTRLALAAGALVAAVLSGVSFMVLREPEPLPLALAAPTLAVLPLANLTGDASQQVIADGITEQLTHTFTRMHYAVVARTSSERFGGRRFDAREIGRQLGATHLVAGSLRQSEGRTRVTLQLASAETGMQLWSGELETPAAGALALQDAVSNRLSYQVALRVPLRPPSELALLGGSSAAVREQMVVAERLQNSGAHTEALAAIDEALTLDPCNAYAHGLAVLNGTAAVNARQRELAAALPYIREHGAAAVACAPANAFAHRAASHAHFFAWEWEEAEREGNRACEIEPLYGACIALFTVYSAQGRAEALLRLARRTEEIAPMNPYVLGNLMPWALSYNLRWEEGERVILRARAISGDKVAGQLSIPQWRLGRREEAVESERLWFASLGDEGTAKEIAREFASGGAEAAWRWLGEVALERAGTSPSGGAFSHITAAFYFAMVGDSESALVALEGGVAAHAQDLPLYSASPIFDPIRDTPRFRALIEQMGLTAYHEKYGVFERARKRVGAPNKPAAQ